MSPVGGCKQGLAFVFLRVPRSLGGVGIVFGRRMYPVVLGRLVLEKLMVTGSKKGGLDVFFSSFFSAYRIVLGIEPTLSLTPTIWIRHTLTPTVVCCPCIIDFFVTAASLRLFDLDSSPRLLVLVRVMVVSRYTDEDGNCGESIDTLYGQCGYVAGR